MPTPCDCGGHHHDHASCASELRVRFTEMGLDVTVSTVPPIVNGPYTVAPYICPHGVRHWAEPTGEQIARWNEQGAP